MADTRAVKVTRLPTEPEPLLMLRAILAVTPACITPINAALRQVVFTNGFRFARIKSAGFILLALALARVPRAVLDWPAAPAVQVLIQLYAASGVFAEAHLYRL